jgi:outer membrane immunogenic protein
MLVGPAAAADLRIKRPVKAPPPVVLYDWTGFYIGGHGGWAWTQKDWLIPQTGFNTVSLQADDGVIGVQGGYNWQTGALVVGIEVQSSWGEVRKGGIKVEPSEVVRRRRAGTTVENVGTIAGRLGYAMDRWLGYVKAGGAWAFDIHRVFDITTGTDILLAATSETRWGLDGGHRLRIRIPRQLVGQVGIQLHGFRQRGRELQLRRSIV